MAADNISRRGFLAGAVGTALASSSTPADTKHAQAASGQTPAAPQKAPATPVSAPAKGPVLGKADIDKMMTDLSNWGRWGKDDQIGTVNLITPAKRKHAASLVREGVCVSMAHEQSTEKLPDNPAPLVHVMTATGREAAGR
jgi:hypothetical protein